MLSDNRLSHFTCFLVAYEHFYTIIKSLMINFRKFTWTKSFVLIGNSRLIVKTTKQIICNFRIKAIKFKKSTLQTMWRYTVFRIRAKGNIHISCKASDTRQNCNANRIKGTYIHNYKIVFFHNSIKVNGYAN